MNWKEIIGRTLGFWIIALMILSLYLVSVWLISLI